MKKFIIKFSHINTTTKIMTGVVSGAIVVAIIIVVSAYITESTQPKIELKQETFIVEYGEPISTEAKDYIKAEKDVLKATTIEIGKQKKVKDQEYLVVGTYNASATLEARGTHKEEKLSFKIVVKDTTAPKFVGFKETLEVKKDNKEFDFAAQYKAEDLSEVIITVNTTKVDFSKVGEYTITVTAIDEYKNETTKDAKVKIVEETEAELQLKEQEAKAKEEAEKAEQEQQSQNANNQGSEPVPYQPGQTTETTNPTPTPEPQPQICNANGQWNLLGNSGYANHDWTTANEWGKANVPIGYGYSVYSTKDNCGNNGWTVEWEKLEW